MKRRFRAAVLLLVLTVLLTTVVFADSGPKPQMAVRVVHAPQEAYYLDLLDEGTYTGAYETDEGRQALADWAGWTRRCCRRFVRRFLQDGTAAFRRAQPERPSGETLPGRQAKTARCFIRSAMSACRRRTGF